MKNLVGDLKRVYNKRQINANSLEKGEDYERK